MIDNDFLKQLMQKAKARSGKRDFTERQVINLMGKAWKAAESRLVDGVVPLIEFFPIENKAQTKEGNWHIFSTRDNSDLSDIQSRLQRAHGIYVFHDSSGCAIYAGKALQQLLWSEINHAFNRDRGEVQSIKRVEWPTSRVGRRDGENEQIKKVPVALHEIARYVSAYQIPTELISRFEAVIIRSFANDLLNVRMEKF